MTTTHAIFLNPVSVAGTCFICGRMAVLMFRDGDTNKLIGKCCWPELNAVNALLRRLEANGDTNADANQSQ